MPFDPFFTLRPRDFQVWNPATRVASGRCIMIRNVLLALYRVNLAATAR